MIPLTEDDARPQRDEWPRKGGRVVVEHDGQTLECYSPSNLTSYLGGGFSNPTWEARCQAKGAGLRPDLAIMAAPLDVKADREQLDRLVAELEEAGGRSAAANRGTAMHSAARCLLRGITAGMPAECADDLAATQAVIDDWGVRLVDDWDERSVFNPHLPALGQVDAFVTCNRLDGVLVLDLKTGAFKPLDCAVQLAAYANATHEARLVDGVVELEPLPFDIRTDVALVLHCPWGGGKADVIAVDIAEGYDMAQLAVSVHQRTLDSGRFRIRELGSLHPSQVEPTGGAAGDPAAIAAPAAPSLHARIGDLRRRANVLVEQGVIDPFDAKAFMAAHGVPPLTKPDDHTASSVDLWEDWITTLEMALDAGARLPGIVARLEALPVDLYAHVERLSKEATPPVPQLNTGKATGPDLDRLEVILSSVELLHAERVAQVAQALSEVGRAGDDCALVHWATENRYDADELAPLATIADLDNLEAERVLALCATYRHDDFAAALRAIGPAKDIVAAARPLAELHQIAPPKAGRDVAADRVLAGLVLITHNSKETT